jgi:hypothetical protein
MTILICILLVALVVCLLSGGVRVEHSVKVEVAYGRKVKRVESATTDSEANDGEADDGV